MQAILHNIRSMHNVGSMFRTADAAGVEKLYLTGITPAPVDEWGRVQPPLTKVSLGAEKTVPWEKCASATQAIKKLKKGGYAIVALEQHKNAVPLDFLFRHWEGRNNETISSRLLYHSQASRFAMTPKKIDRVALVMGNEVRGLSPAVVTLADYIVEIPMRGKKESLNVAVAFGIAAYWFLFFKPR